MPKQLPPYSGRQIIFVGTTANDGTGDTLRNAFVKTNDNFDLLYGVAGLSAGFKFSKLYETPEDYVANTLVTVNEFKDGLVYRTVNSDDIMVNITENQVKLELSPVLANNISFAGNTVFSGEFSINTSRLNLAATAADATAANEAGLHIGGANATLKYQSAFDSWTSNKSVLPTVSGQINLGAQTRKWNDIWVSDIYADTLTLAGTITGTVSDISNHNSDGLVEGTTNRYYTVARENNIKAYVGDAIAGLVNGAPGSLDTLNELATALGNNASFASTITNSLAQKANISSLATVATSGSYDDLLNKPTISSFTNDSGYQTAAQVTAAIQSADSVESESTNTPNTLVLRDGSGNFAAGTITANLTGNVSGTLLGTIATSTTATTQPVGNNSTQVATTAYVINQLAASSSSTTVSGVASFSAGSTGLGPSTASTGNVVLSGTLSVDNGGTGVTTSTGTGSTVRSASPSLTGTPTAPTATVNTNTTQLATTAFVINQVSAASANALSSFSAGTTGLTPSTAATGAVTLAGTLSVDNGGTGATTASDAQTNLDVPSRSGANATGTWDIDVSFEQAGTAAITRTVSLKLKENVSVEDFGAVGDGVVDDTAAIQAAINSGALKIIAQAGKIFRITNTLTINISKLQVDFQTSELRLDDSTGLKDHIFLGNGTVQLDGVNISNIIFTRQQDATDGYAINSNFTKVIGISNCRVFGNNRIHGGFRIYQGIIVNIQNNYIDNCRTNGIYLQGSNATTGRTIDVTIRENRIEGGTTALETWDFVEGLFCRDNIFYNPSSAAVTLNASSNTNGLVSFKLQENDFDSCGSNGVFINNVNNIQLTNNWFSNNDATDLVLGTNTEAVIIEGNQFYPIQNAIQISGKDVQLTSNLVSGGITCIALTGTAQRINISSNILSNSSQAIDISTADNVLVTGNQIYGTSVGNIVNETTGTNISIYSNRDNSSGSSVVASIGPSPATYTATARSQVINVVGGTVSEITSNGIPLSFSSNCTLVLAPNQSIVITYSAVPTLVRTLGI